MAKKTRPHKPYRASFSHSLRYAFYGIAYALRQERNIRIQAVGFVAVLLVSFLISVPPAHIALLVLTAIGVVMMEIVNSAIEALADAVHPAFHPGIKVAKDMAAGAVLVMSLGAVVIGLLILAPPLLATLY